MEVSKLKGDESREHLTPIENQSKLSEDKGKLMGFWFGRKSAPDARPFVPAWLNSEQQQGFARSYDNSSNGMTGEPEAIDQRLGIGDGVTTRFELRKAYGTGEQRRITRPVAGSVRVAVNGVELQSGWSIEPGGAVALDEPPPTDADITAGFVFDVPVRFSEDRIEINRATFRAGEAPSVPLVEIREA